MSGGKRDSGQKLVNREIAQKFSCQVVYICRHLSRIYHVIEYVLSLEWHYFLLQ